MGSISDHKSDVCTPYVVIVGEGVCQLALAKYRKKKLDEEKDESIEGKKKHTSFCRIGGNKCE